jgi:cytochrome c553
MVLLFALILLVSRLLAMLDRMIRIGALFRLEPPFRWLLSRTTDLSVLVSGMAWIAAPSASASAESEKAHFVGSASCKGCHAEAYKGWKQTRMANAILDPTKHPEAVLGDFERADPVRTFGLDQVAFVYGSRWKQRYFTKRGDDYYPLPAQWDVKGARWLPYHVEPGTDWWLPFYGPSNFDRPTGPTCDGCHSVNYDVQTNQVTEWNVGCEDRADHQGQFCAQSRWHAMSGWPSQ